jgi:hypothetical protein
MNARGTYRKAFAETTGLGKNTLCRLQSTTGRPDLGKAFADARQQAVADLAIGLKLLLAIALGG